MDPGLIGAIIGSVFGILGGVVGTYFSIKNTNGPKERAFMIRVSFVAWVAVITFITLMLLLPSPYKHLLWVPYALALVFGIKTSNRRQMEVRSGESDA